MVTDSIPSGAGEKKRRGRENLGKAKPPSQSWSLDVTGVNPTVEEENSCQSSVYLGISWKNCERILVMSC